MRLALAPEQALGVAAKGFRQDLERHFAVDPPRKLFDLPEPAFAGEHAFDVADGRFLMILQDPRESGPLRLVVAPNWLEELKAKLRDAEHSQ